MAQGYDLRDPKCCGYSKPVPTVRLFSGDAQVSYGPSTLCIRSGRSVKSNFGARDEAGRSTPAWVVSPKVAGLDKRQATLMPCIRPSGEQFVPVTLTFRGLGASISYEELMMMVENDATVNVLFQPYAWADSFVMLEWLKKCFVPSLRKAGITGPVMLGMDRHGAQISPVFRAACSEHDIYQVYTPEGTTDITAPVDRHVGCHIKRGMQREWKKELEKNYTLWTAGDATIVGKAASYRRMLMIAWCSDAWADTRTKTLLLLHAFLRTGFLSKKDGSDKHELEVRGFANYDPDDARWEPPSSSEDPPSSSEEN